MSRYSKEEWERRKSYLIRSLFEDLPMLSPINESQEPPPSSPSDSNIYRPESPLPELIIEKEPPKHQESEDEEFYEMLAKEMRRRYRKDFLNEDTVTNSSSDTSSEVTDENYIQKDSFDEGSRSLEEKSVEDDNVDEEDSSEIIKEKQQEFVSSQEEEEEDDDYFPDITKQKHQEEIGAFSTESSDSEEINRQEEITTKADVHADVTRRFEQSLRDRTQRSGNISVSKLIEVVQYSCSFKNVSDRETEDHEEESGHRTHRSEKISRSKSTEIVEFSYSAEKSDHGQCTDHEAESEHAGPQELATPTEASQESSIQKFSGEYDQMTPEIIRRRQTMLSDDSLPLHELPVRESNEQVISKNVTMEIDNTIMSDNITSSTFEMAVDASKSDSNTFHCTATSTPKSFKSPRLSIARRYKERLVPYSPSSRGSEDLEREVALQTSFSSDHEPEWKDLWSNFFVGTPIVYNLCSCNDHVCS